MKRLLNLFIILLAAIALLSCDVDDTVQDSGVKYYTAKSSTVTSDVAVSTIDVVTETETAADIPETTAVIESVIVTTIAPQADIVTEKETTTTAATTVTTVATTTTAADSNDLVVYVTPSGKKYHYIKTCPGKNSTPTTLSKAIASGKEPCKKCVD